MKRLLSFLMALSILFSLIPSALAEGAEEPVPCAINSACTLEADHDGECSLLPEETAGIMEIADSDENRKVLYAADGGNYFTELSVFMGDPSISVQFFYFAEGESPLVLDDRAVFTVTDRNGNPSDGVVLEKNSASPSLYTISFTSAAPYKLVCSLDGKVIGSIDFYVNSGDFGGGDLTSPGLSFRVEKDGEVHYYNGNGAVVGQPSVYDLFYNGVQLTDPDAPLVYDDSVLRVEKLNWGWEITALVPGDLTLNYEGNNNGFITLHAQERTGVNVDNPPNDLEGLYFCWMDNGQRRWGNNLSVSGTFTATLVYVEDGVSTVVRDSSRLTYTPSEGLNRRFSNGVLEIQSGGRPDTYTITYTHTDNSQSSLTVRYGQGGINLNNPPVSPGVYFCWTQNGQTMWGNSVRFSGQFRANLVQVKLVDGNKVASLLTDGSKVSVSPSDGGLRYTLTGSVCAFEGVKGGTYTLTYTESATEQYELTVVYDDGTIDLTDVPSEPGLYHAIYDNHYMFSNQKGVSMVNGQGMTFGPLILVNRKGEKMQLTDPDLLDTSKTPYLKVSPAGGMTLSYDSGNKSWVMRATKADLYTITYVDKDNTTYSATCTIWENGKLYASVDGGNNWLDILHVTEDEPTKVEFAWKNQAGNYIKTIGTVNGSNDQIHITRDMNTGISTLIVDNPDVNANASYHYDDYHTYMMKVISHEAYRLALKAGSAQTVVYDYAGEVGSEIPVEVRFGQPSKGLNPYSGALTVSAGLSLTDHNGNGGYRLKILKEGTHTISFTHSCTTDCPNICDIAGKTFSVRVQGIPKSNRESFFALPATSSFPVFGSELIAGETQTLRLCYGTYGNYTVLTASQLSVEGDAVTLKQNGDAVDVIFRKNGQALIQYVDRDKIVHNYVVKCYAGLAELGMAHYSEQGHNTVNLSYKGKTITVGPAIFTDDKMWMWPGNSFNHSVADDWDVFDNVVIGAMYAGEGNSVTEPADVSFYNCISNIDMSLVHCKNTVPNPNGEYNVVIEEPTTYEWNGLPLQLQKFQGTKGLYFEADLMISFDVEMDKKTTYRFYRPADLSYRAIPDDQVTLNLADADVLNTLLSNSYTLINYLEANVPGFKYGGGNLTLKLPAVTYDKVLVSQLILPGSSDVLSIFTIQGTEQDGKRTTVPGIYSKGFLHGVDNLNFVANPDATMTFAGETFTCGLLVNNTRSAIQPEFDLATLKKYHPEFQGLSDAEAQAKFEKYNPSVSTNGNSYNLGNITNCRFSDFEYAMRTDAGGFVQGARDCIIERCKFGVYINAGGVKTLHTDGRANTIWRNNQFIENWAPVRITGLPDDLSAYYIRFIDNTFIRNNKDFWVTAKGHYYFYRNYYSGHWNAAYWQSFWKGNNGTSTYSRMQQSDMDQNVARAANLEVEANTVLVTNPCRSVPDSNENLWIFDTDNLQNTVILQSEANNLKVASGAIKDLGDVLDIPVLNDKEETVGIWTIYEGGDTQ